MALANVFLTLTHFHDLSKLGSGLTERFNLTDRYIRRRAIKALERDGTVEVRRPPGACTLLRLKVDR